MSIRPIALVTGGTGFIGRSLVEQRSSRAVTSCGSLDAAQWSDGEATPISNTCARIFPGTRRVLEAGRSKNAAEIFHLAAATSGTAEYYHRVSVESTERLLELVAVRGGRVVLVSFPASVYDGGSMSDGSVINEEFPLEQEIALSRADSYARAKDRRSELRAHDFLETILW